MDEADFENLNALALDELAAVEVYIQALRKVDDKNTEMQLRACRDTHSSQFEIIVAKICQMGRAINTDSHNMISLMSLLSQMTCEDISLIVSALESAEDKRSQNYEKLANDTSLEGKAVACVAREILLGQDSVNARIQDLKFRKDAEIKDVVC